VKSLKPVSKGFWCLGEYWVHRRQYRISSGAIYEIYQTAERAGNWKPTVRPITRQKEERLSVREEAGAAASAQHFAADVVAALKNSVGTTSRIFSAAMNRYCWTLARA